jgi:glucose-6-phosphate-specific signal transduction histidine kinase
MLSLIKPSQNNPDNRQRKRLIKVCLPIFTLSYHYGNSGDVDACLFAVCRAFADFSRG